MRQPVLPNVLQESGSVGKSERLVALHLQSFADQIGQGFIIINNGYVPLIVRVHWQPPSVHFV